jgi:FixJ family two-component response regulator
MSPARKVVAIVDNEYTVRRALKRVLRAQGILSEDFASGDEFLQFLEVCRPDCVILGRHTTQAGSFDVLRRMAAADLHIPVIVLAGRDAAAPRKRKGLAVIKPFPATAEAGLLLRRRASRRAGGADRPTNPRTH